MTCRKPWKFVSLLAAALLISAQSTAVIFERADIRIDPVAIAPVAPDAPTRLPVDYNIEVRSEEALRLEYIHTLNTLTDTSGVAIIFTAPGMVPLPRMQVFTPVDALFVAEDGTILQIYPNVVLGELQQRVTAKEPVHAFVFLQAGQVTARGILPRDIIAGNMFYPSPPVME